MSHHGWDEDTFNQAVEELSETWRQLEESHGREVSADDVRSYMSTHAEWAEGLKGVLLDRVAEIGAELSYAEGGYILYDKESVEFAAIKNAVQQQCAGSEEQKDPQASDQLIPEWLR